MNRSVVSSASFCGFIGITILSSTTLAQDVKAPPLRCEITYSSWCILEGASEIVSKLSSDPVIRREWQLKGFDKSAPPLIVLEPPGCRKGNSSVPRLLDVKRNQNWNGQIRDVATVQLKSDGSCSISLIIPTIKQDPSRDALMNIALLQGCNKDGCASDQLSFGPIRAAIYDLH